MAGAKRTALRAAIIPDGTELTSTHRAKAMIQEAENLARFAKGKNGRALNGRFIKGWKGGTGNPNLKAVGEWRQALLEAITPDDLREIIGKLLEAAREGKHWAIVETLNRCLGRPRETIDMTLEDRGASMPDLGRLSDKTRRAMLAELGGPVGAN